MTKAQKKILETLRTRPHTRSELITVACRSGCRFVRTAELAIDNLLNQRLLERYRNRNLEIWMYQLSPGGQRAVEREVAAAT